MVVFCLFKQLCSFDRVPEEELLLKQAQIEAACLFIYILVVHELHFEHVLKGVKREDFDQNELRVVRVIHFWLEHTGVVIHFQSLEPEEILIVQNLLSLQDVGPRSAEGILKLGVTLS